MYSEQIQGQWNEVKIKIKEKWEKIPQKKIDQLEGKLDHLTVLLQEYYDFDKKQAEEEVRAFEQAWCSNTGNCRTKDIQNQKDVPFEEPHRPYQVFKTQQTQRIQQAKSKKY